MASTKYILPFLIIACIYEIRVSPISNEKRPRILLSMNVRNEEHTLPTFFGYIDKLDYPKDRISLLIQTDHNEDDSARMITEWALNTREKYHTVNIRHSAQPTTYGDSSGPTQYTISRYNQLIQNYQVALSEARKMWSDYLFYVNTGNFLINNNTLNILINQNKTIVAPMLKLFYQESNYSNFWAGMDERGYYKRVPEYFDIFERKQRGSFEVPLIHSTILIDLRDKRTDDITLFPIPADYQGDTDHILLFSWAVKKANLSLHICNLQVFGHLMEVYLEDMTLQERHQQFTDVFVDYLAYHPPLARSQYITPKFPTPDKKGFDEIFMINLVRRPDRRLKMERSFRELGIDYKYFPAVDGKNMTKQFLDEMGIKPMNDFKDPFLERPITMGEIGCFLSHWYIWKEMVERNLEMVLILEDDIRFESNFNKKLKEVMGEARGLLAQGIEWDLMYLGRKPLIYEEEVLMWNCTKIVWGRYSYWTLGYVLTLSGAKQLLEGDPLSKMIPVDEYIPLKFNAHPKKKLKRLYLPRDMLGLSAHPLLLYPTHYVGDPGHFSDTEDTLSFEEKDVSGFLKKKLEETGDNVEEKEKSENVTITKEVEKETFSNDIATQIRSEL